MSAGGTTKVVLLALAANLGIAAAKFAGALYSGSSSLMAEAIHSFVDSSNQFLLLLGGRAARKRPSASHPLGYGRELFFWSFIVAMFLFSLGGLFAIYEGVHKLGAEHETPGSPLLGLAILAASVALELSSYLACLKEIRERPGFRGYWKWFRKSSEVELLVVFTEDSAAMAGLAAASAALLLTWWTGNPAWDAIGSIVVGAILVVVSLFLSVEIKSLLVGEAPSRDYRPEIARLLAEEIPQARLLRFIAVHHGGSEVLVSYKITPGKISGVKELITAINRVEERVKERFPEIHWQFVEPDCED